MRKYFMIFLTIAFLFAAGCSTSGDTDTTADSAAVSEETAADTTTADETTTEDTATPFTTAEDPCQTFNLVDDVLLSPVNDQVPAITDADLVVGPDDATYTFITYSNFTCSHCANLEPVLAALQELYPQDVRLVFRYVTTGSISTLSAQAVEAADLQGKFAEMKDAIFAAQATWWEFSDDEFRAWLDERAAELGMDVDQFNADMENENIANKIIFNRSQVDDLGITGTPTMFVNNRQYSPYQDRSIFTLATMVRVMEISDQLLGSCPTVDTGFDADLQAVISTTQGDIVVDLYEDQAPNTVAYFKYLADNGWYDNNDIFISTDEYIVSGDPSDTLYGGPGFVFYNEISEGTMDEEGLLVSFNRLGTGYNSGLFMLTKGAVTDFSGDISIFGKVIEGMDVLNSFSEHTYTLESADWVFDTILSITVQEK